MQISVESVPATSCKLATFCKLGNHHGGSAEVFLLQEELERQPPHSDSGIGCELFFCQVCEFVEWFAHGVDRN